MRTRDPPACTHAFGDPNVQRMHFAVCLRDVGAINCICVCVSNVRMDVVFLFFKYWWNAGFVNVNRVSDQGGISTPATPSQIASEIVCLPPGPSREPLAHRGTLHKPALLSAPPPAAR